MELSWTAQVGPHRLGVRAVAAADEGFLRALYATVRAPELAQTDWPEDLKSRFLDQQFAAQTRAYTDNYPGARWLILTVDGTDAGRLYLHERPEEIRIMDLALLPDWRNRGIGTAALREVLHQGETTRRRVTIHVEVFNPALRLYQRLGFTQVAANDVYLLLEWKPASSV